MGKLIAVVLAQIYFNNRTEEIKCGPRLIIGYPTRLMTCVTWHYGHEQWRRAGALKLFSRVGHKCGHKKAAVGTEKVCDWGTQSTLWWCVQVRKGCFAESKACTANLSLNFKLFMKYLHTQSQHYTLSYCPWYGLIENILGKVPNVISTCNVVFVKSFLLPLSSSVYIAECAEKAWPDSCILLLLPRTHAAPSPARC